MNKKSGGKGVPVKKQIEFQPAESAFKGGAPANPPPAEFGIRFQTKSEGVFQELRRRILTGQLEPGMRLDQEALAAEFAVSRMPLREALQKLEADGLVEHRPHRGAVVSPLSLLALEEIYATRGALESMLAEAGALRIGIGELERMSAIIDKQKRAIGAGDGEEYVRLDREFHATLYAASGYSRACEILSKLRDSSDRYIRIYARDRGAVANSIREHEELLENCRKGMAADVRRHTEQHIRKGLAVLIAVAKQQSKFSQ